MLQCSLGLSPELATVYIGTEPALSNRSPFDAPVLARFIAFARYGLNLARSNAR